MDLEPVPPAGRQLRRGERHAHPGPAARPGIREQRTPAATEVEQAAPRPDPDLLGHVVVLAPLCLLEIEREIAVELRPAEIGELTETEPNDPISQRIGEVSVPTDDHLTNIRLPVHPPPKTTRAWDPPAPARDELGLVAETIPLMRERDTS